MARVVGSGARMHGLEVRPNQQLSRRKEGCRCTKRISLAPPEPTLLQETPHVALKKRDRRQLDLLAEPRGVNSTAHRPPPALTGPVQCRVVESQRGQLAAVDLGRAMSSHARLTLCSQPSALPPSRSHSLNSHSLSHLSCSVSPPRLPEHQRVPVLTGSVACAAATLGGAQWQTAVLYRCSAALSARGAVAVLALPLQRLSCYTCCCLHLTHALDSCVHVAVPNGHVGHFGFLTHSPRSGWHLAHANDLPLQVAIMKGHV